jgi:hypothetical protein
MEAGIMDNKEIQSMLSEWLQKLDQSMAHNNSKEICEASRMVISFLSILKAFRPDVCKENLIEHIRTSFDDALSCIGDDIKEGKDPDGLIDLYYRNVTVRRQTLKHIDVKDNAKGKADAVSG